MFRKILIPVLLMIGLPAMAIAHSGHGAFNGHELAHYLLSPDHAIPVAIGLVLLAVLYGRRKWAKQRQEK